MRKILIVSMILGCCVVKAQTQEVITGSERVEAPTEVAQNSASSSILRRTTQDKLMGKEWVIDVPNSTISRVFDGSDKTKLILVEGVCDAVKSPYYLSYTEDTRFDTTKVGESQFGDFIVIKARGNLLLYKIITLTDTQLILQNVTSGRMIRDAATIKHRVK